MAEAGVADQLLASHRRSVHSPSSWTREPMLSCLWQSLRWKTLKVRRPAAAGHGHRTVLTEFLLMDVSSSRELQVLQGLLFLLLYLGALAGNLLTVAAIVADPRLHAPMYFFIGNLSVIDLCCISVSVPKLIANSLAGSRAISLGECAAQIFFHLFFASMELAFLVVMSYDRYVAICAPLHYGLTLTPRMSSAINQYFCDVPQVVRIAAPAVQLSESVILAVSAGLVMACFAFLVLSYVSIFSTVLRIRSPEARNKALSTCTPQLAILLLFVVSGLVAVLGPIANEASLKTLLTAVFYIMVPPLANPLIYSLRNREIGRITKEERSGQPRPLKRAARLRLEAR
ncbi:PREDICTED: olfactory receptor 14I1-like [Condylura cristata]|uniref:olfactory receptor 14I1-like n=1 Tax=Condylura cristata TaxID=143302 RepID=UPI000642BFDB|nr:PREDICTED: olfactory receptor 14I1-like [Condylura cristata]